MKVQNVKGQKIIIEGSYFEIGQISMAVDDYVQRNPDNEIIKELAHTLRNPGVVTDK